MAQNPEIAQINDANKITFNLELAQESGIYWNRDHKYHSHLQVIFHGLNIQSLIDRLDSIPSDELKQIISSANQFRRLLGSLNIRWRKNTQPLTVLKKILNLFGFTAAVFSKSNDLYFYTIKPLLSTYHAAIYDAIKKKYSEELVLRKPEKMTNRYEESQRNTPQDFYPRVKLSDNNISSDRFTRSSKQDIPKNTPFKSGMKENPRKNEEVREKVEPENNNLLGKKVNYMHPKRWEMKGIIEKIEGCIYWIKDLITSELMPCAIDQVEFI